MALRVFKLNPNAFMPKYATGQSAGFDLHACLEGASTLKGYNLNNREVQVEIRKIKVNDMQVSNSFINLLPGLRVLVPTGLIFDIPVASCLKVYARSGNSFKKGLVLVNSVGIIDSDYVDELFAMVMNLSDTAVRIEHGDRVAQAVEVQHKRSPLNEITERPQLKGDRKGGLGSTGV